MHRQDLSCSRGLLSLRVGSSLAELVSPSWKPVKAPACCNGGLGPSPPATTTAAMPPADPAAASPARRWWPTPARSWTWTRTPPRSGAPSGSRTRSPLGLRQEIRLGLGPSKIGSDRHRLHTLDEPNADCADRRCSNGILRQAKEGTAGGTAHYSYSSSFHAALRTDGSAEQRDHASRSQRDLFRRRWMVTAKPQCRHRTKP